MSKNTDRQLVQRLARECGPHFGEAVDRVRREGYAEGAKDAARTADVYNASSVHDLMIGDCILFKMNLWNRRPRRNKLRVEHPDPAWIRGFATTLAEVYRLLADGNDAKGICRIARAAGVRLVDLRAAKAHPRDIRALRQAGLL